MLFACICYTLNLNCDLQIPVGHIVGEDANNGVFGPGFNQLPLLASSPTAISVAQLNRPQLALIMNTMLKTRCS